MVSRFSITKPCCISSEYKILQPASRAEEIIFESNGCNKYLLKIDNAFVITDSFSGWINEAFINSETNRIATLRSILYFLRQTFKHSKTTCGLMKGTFCRSEEAISFLRLAFKSRRYSAMLLSMKKLSLISLVTIKFKTTHVNL